MLEPNEQDIEKFVVEKRRNDLSELTIRMYVRQMTELAEHIGAHRADPKSCNVESINTPLCAENVRLLMI
jgi:ribosomal protein S15P/S13E